MRTLVVFLLVLAVAGVAGDRVAEHVAAGEAESRLAAHGIEDPQVDVGGFPFVTQLLSRSFTDVRVTGAGVEADGARAEQVRVTGRDVYAPDGGDVTVGDLRGQGLVTYDEVVRRSGLRGVDIEQASADRVRLRGDVLVLGESLPVTALCRVRAEGPELRVTPDSFELADGGPVGASLGSELADRFTVSYRMRDLPEGVRLHRVAPRPDGFLVVVRGSDVVFEDIGS